MTVFRIVACQKATLIDSQAYDVEDDTLINAANKLARLQAQAQNTDLPLICPLEQGVMMILPSGESLNAIRPLRPTAVMCEETKFAVPHVDGDDTLEEIDPDEIDWDLQEEEVADIPS